MKELNLIAEVGGLPTISINDTEIKEQLVEEMKVYTTIVFTEEQKAEAKADLATLRKFRSAIDDKRKEIKKEYLKPYEEFDGKVKGLLAIIDEPIGLIDSKVKEFEEKRKAEKIERIKAIYAEELSEYPRVTLESIFKPSWENATCTESSIRADMQEIKLDVSRELNIILSLKSEATDKAIDKYYESKRNLALAIDFINQYEATKAEVIAKQEESKQAQNIRFEHTDDKTPTSQVTPPVFVKKEGSFKPLGFINDSDISNGFVNDIITVHLDIDCERTKVNDLINLLTSHGYEVERTF